MVNKEIRDFAELAILDGDDINALIQSITTPFTTSRTKTKRLSQFRTGRFIYRQLHGASSSDIGKPVYLTSGGIVTLWDDAASTEDPLGILLEIYDTDHVVIAPEGSVIDIPNTLIPAGMPTNGSDTNARHLRWDASAGSYVHTPPADSQTSEPQIYWIGASDVSGNDTVRVLSGHLGRGVRNVLDFGADPTFTNNSTSAFVNALATSPSTLIVPQGRYKITSQIQITDSVQIIGDGSGDSIVEMTSNDTTLFRVQGVSTTNRVADVKFRDIWLRGPAFSGTPTEPTDYANGCGILAQFCQRVSVESCNVSHFPSHAVRFDETTAAKVTDCFLFEQYYDLTWAGAAEIYTGINVDGLEATNNYLLSNNKLGMFLSGIGKLTDVNVIGNVIVPMDSNGNQIAAASVKRIHGINYSYGSSAPVTGQLGRRILANNIIHNTLWGGIYATSDNTSPDANGIRVVLQGNLVSNFGLDTTGADPSLPGGIVLMGCREGVITGNIILDCQSSDHPSINLFQQFAGADIVCKGNIIKENPSWGIRCSSWAAGIVIEGNQLINVGKTGRGAIHCDSSASRISDKSVTVDTVADTLTATSHGYIDGDIVKIQASTVPGGLAIDTIYWVVNATSNTVQLANSSDGSPIDITSTGSGVTLVDAREIGGHTIRGNVIECRDDAVFIDIPNETRDSVVDGNRMRNILDARTGDGLQVEQDSFVMTGNYIEGFLFGVRAPGVSGTVSGRLIDQIKIDNNTFVDTTYCVRVINDASSTALVVCQGNTYRGETLRHYSVATSSRDGVILEGKILAHGTATPTFGTWETGDRIINTGWTSATDFADWICTTAGSPGTWTGRKMTT